MKPDYLNTPCANEGADDVIALLKLCQLLPITTTLSAIGAEMERRGEISVLPGEDYAQKALARLTVQYLSSGDNTQ
ncbi:hypothetical protein ACXDSS_005408 [Klebsiella quasipneumoniae]